MDVDQYGNAVSGVTVTFAPPGSGASGTFTTSATAVTNAAGLATSNTFTANTIAGGPYNVVASAPGATPTINFAMTNNAGTAHTVTATSGTNQSTIVNTAFTNALGATVTDQYGNTVAGVTVTFTPPASGASGTFTTSATAVTNAAGLATSNTYTANTIAGGPYNVVASAPGATTSANFAETNLAGTAHTVTATSGANQSTTVATAFTNALGATVTDQYGNAVAGVTVTFTPPASGASGTFTTSATAVTNAAGLATSNTYTANTIAGTGTVVASAPGATTSANFAETNTAKTTGDTLSLVSGSPQSATVNTAFANKLVVMDVDQYGNAVSGVTVTFTPPGSGASGTFTTAATAVTGTNGQATSNTYTANTTAGTYNVVASATGCHTHDQLRHDQPCWDGPHRHRDLGGQPEPRPWARPSPTRWEPRSRTSTATLSQA